MRCIFCKNDSKGSKSKEHIIPESLGNKEHVLEPGVVCDGCNNYFSIKLEKPILEYPSIKQMRFESLIESKKGRVPFGVGWSGGSLVDIENTSDGIALIFHDESVIQNILKGKVNSIMVPSGINIPDNDRLFSRFLAKMALELLTSKVIDVEGWNEEIVDNQSLDPIRNYARFNVGFNPHWLYNVRRIYDAGQMFYNKKVSNRSYEVLHEMDILITELNETYLVFAILGIECVINIGGSSIEGYLAHLESVNGVSILDSRDERVKVNK